MEPPKFTLKDVTPLPSDPLDALQHIAGILFEQIRIRTQAEWPPHYVGYCEVYGLLRSYQWKVEKDVEFAVVATNLGKDITKNVQTIQSFAGTILHQVSQQRIKLTTEAAIRRGNQFVEDFYEPALLYEFSDSDCEQMAGLINELKILIESTDELSTSHKRRLLKRLESLRAEIAKTVSNVDRMRGFASEAWMTAKIIVSNPEKANQWMSAIGKLMLIIAAAQAMAHGLPIHDLPKLLPWVGSGK